MPKSPAKRKTRVRTKVNDSTRARQWEARFLATLRKEPNITKACAAANVSRVAYYAYAKTDAEFRARVDDAIDEGCDELESVAWGRSVHGVKRPVYQGGELVGYTQEYSDTLMCLLLKAHKPLKYRERSLVETSNLDDPTGDVEVE